MSKAKSKSKSKKQNAKPQPKAECCGKCGAMDVGGMSLWRDIARACAPDVDDKWKTSEIATANKLLAQGIIARNWQDIDRMAGIGGKVSVSFTLVIDRTGDIPHVKIEGSPKIERPKWRAESDVPDPDQNELPFEAEAQDEAVSASAEPEENNEPAPEDEPEEKPRVRSAEEGQ